MPAYCAPVEKLQPANPCIFATVRENPLNQTSTGNLSAATAMKLCCHLFTIGFLSVINVQSATLVSHVGANNPLTEGFSNPQNSGVVTVGPLLNDQGRSAWSIDSGGANFYYNYNLSQAAADSANSLGWSLKMNLRLVDIPDPADFGVYADFASTAGIFQMGFGVQPDGDPVLQLITDGTPLVYSLELGGSGYHEYDIRYNPLTHSADVHIDGVLRVTGWQGRSLPVLTAQSNFGSFFDPGHANWNEFTFSVIPEPASGLLVLLGFVGVASGRLKRR